MDRLVSDLGTPTTDLIFSGERTTLVRSLLLTGSTFGGWGVKI